MLWHHTKTGSWTEALIGVVHDEYTFYVNSNQSFWGDDHTNVLRQKSLSASIMVSDFIDEVAGYIRDDEDQVRVIIETQIDGYFTNDHLMEQVRKTVDIFEITHPGAIGLFLFDNAPHIAKWQKMLYRMNVAPGGKQPRMRDTVWGGVVRFKKWSVKRCSKRNENNSASERRKMNECKGYEKFT